MPNAPSGQRISACLIVKDEEDNIAQCLASIRPFVDEIICVDTGSSDRTKEVAAQNGAAVYQFDHQNHPEAFFVDDESTCSQFGAPGPFSGEWALGDFAAARNESFSHATGDYVMWIDADDVMDGAESLRTVVADMAARGFDIGFLPYNYATDDKGRVFYRQWRERIFKRGISRWLNPVHEVLMPIGPPGPHARYEQPIYQHRRKADRKGIAHRNYKILLRQLWQEKTEGKPTDPRTLFYLGQEARFIDAKRAVSFYSDYLKMSGWPEERAAAHCAIGMLLEFGALGIPADDALQQANREYATAAAEMPDNPDGVFGMARVAYLRGRHIDCVNYTERGLKIGNTDTMLGTNPMDRIYRPHVYYNHSLAQLGRIDEAIKSCEAGLEVCPDDPGVPGGAPGMLKHNLAAYKTHKASQTVPAPSKDKASILFDKGEDLEAPPAMNIPRDAMVIWAMQLWKQNIAAGDEDKARKLLSGLPSTVTSDPVIARMFESTDRRFGKKERKDIKNGTVVMWLGPGVEPWNPETPNTEGLGGSETAAIEMAKNLVSLGHEVTVYAEATGKWDGVTYTHHSTFSGATCDVFIASRAPWISDAPIHANLKLLWVHDIHCGPPSPQMERWLYRFDRILCLSEWHKGYFLSVYPSVHPDTVIVTRNGIDPSRFSDLPEKQNRLVFSSSPNRGIIELLGFMPKIAERVPDVHLDIYYGFDTWETMAKQRNDANELAVIAQYKAAIDEGVKSGRVTFHGRKSQRELAAAFLRAKVWGYPTGFPETSCISAMEAQAAGCWPVYYPVAALTETVKHGISSAPETFVDDVVNALSRAHNAEGRGYVLNSLSWSSLASEWSQMFDSLREQVKADPVPLWRAA